MQRTLCFILLAEKCSVSASIVPSFKKSLTFSPVSRTWPMENAYTFIDSPEHCLELNSTAWESRINKTSLILHSRKHSGWLRFLQHSSSLLMNELLTAERKQVIYLTTHYLLTLKMIISINNQPSPKWVSLRTKLQLSVFDIGTRTC